MKWKYFDPMKRLSTFFTIFLAGICFLTLFLFSACDSFHFSNPLPVDSKNIYKVPQSFRGEIRNIDDRKLSEYVLEKNAILIKDPDTLKIIKGIWFHPADTFSAAKSDTVAWQRVWRLPQRPSMFTVHFDSLKRPIDTVRNYILHHDKIFRIQSDKLENGTKYKVKNDTIYAYPGRSRIIFGPNAFLRKVNSDLYLFNMNIIDDEDGDWWFTLLLVKGKDGHITIYDWDKGIGSDPSMIYQNDHDYYFDSKWTRADIVKFFEQGMFKDVGMAIFPE